ACGIDDEGIAFPMSNGITQPGGIEITDLLWKLAPVGVDRSMGTVRRLVKHRDQSGTLDDLRQTSKIEERNAHRQAARERAVLSGLRIDEYRCFYTWGMMPRVGKTEGRVWWHSTQAFDSGVCGKPPIPQIRQTVRREFAELAPGPY